MLQQNISNERCQLFLGAAWPWPPMERWARGPTLLSLLLSVRALEDELASPGPPCRVDQVAGKGSEGLARDHSATALPVVRPVRGAHEFSSLLNPA